MENSINKKLSSSLIILSILFFSCNSGKEKWKEVVSYFQSDSLTVSSAKSRLSQQALKAIIPVENQDSVMTIKNFFTLLGDNSDYKIDRSGDSIVVRHYPGDDLGPGPNITIRKDGNTWLISKIVRNI